MKTITLKAAVWPAGEIAAGEIAASEFAADEIAAGKIAVGAIAGGAIGIGEANRMVPLPSFPRGAMVVRLTVVITPGCDHG